MNKNETMNGTSAIGEISVLSPSQKREQERLRKEKEAREAAIKEKRRIATEKKKAEQDRKQNVRVILWVLYVCICAIIGYFLIVAYKYIVHEIYGEDALDTFAHQIGVFIVGGEFYWMIAGTVAFFVCKGIYGAFGLGNPIK